MSKYGQWTFCPSEEISNQIRLRKTKSVMKSIFFSLYEWQRRKKVKEIFLIKKKKKMNTVVDKKYQWKKTGPFLLLSQIRIKVQWLRHT